MGDAAAQSFLSAGRPLPPGFASPGFAAGEAVVGLFLCTRAAVVLRGSAGGSPTCPTLASQPVKQNMTLPPLDSGVGSISFPLCLAYLPSSGALNSWPFLIF